MRTLAFATIAFLLILTTLRAQPVQPLNTAEPMPRAVLEQIYQHELGDAYTPQIAEQLYQAHLLIEEFFQRSDRRKEIVATLQQMQLDANLLGRLIRIRMHWPELLGGVYYVNEKLGPHDVHYFLGVPKEYDRTKSWPLVIKLPTADAFIGEPPADADQVKGIYTAWMTDELIRHPDAIVIMPLLNLDELWGPSYRGMNSVIQPMLHAADRVNIDPARVHLMGHSMSAHASWNLALHYPTYFASFCALAGGAGAEWQRVRVMNLRNVLAVVWHDFNDDVVKVDSSRRLVRILRQMKIPVEYEETKKLGHTPPDMIVERCHERMRGKVRELYPNRVSIQSNRLDTMFNRNDWVQIYLPHRAGEERRMFFRRGSGHMLVHPNLWKVEATLKNQTIDVIATNVEVMRFYLNDHMIDFNKPVMVNVNRRTRFEGIVKPDIDQMLKDQIFLGRGWRYYSAFIDIDFGAGAAPSTRPATESTDDQ